MLKIKFLPFLCLIYLCISCGQENKPKFSYDEEGAAAVVIDSIRVMMGDLPLQIDSLDYLIHPVGKFNLYETSGFYSNFGTSGGSGSSGNYSVLNHAGPDTFWGELYNLKFQPISSDSLFSLTHKHIRIYSLSFLREVFEKTGKDHLLYRVNDEDTNRDGKVDRLDLNTLYISRTNGQDFLKLSHPAQEVIDWRYIPARNRVYFRSIEDSNRNGKFEEEDRLHYFYIDFNAEDLSPVEYFPVSPVPNEVAVSASP